MSLTYIIDFDSTLISMESLDELARVGMTGSPEGDALMARFAELTSLAMEGKLAFDESLAQRVALLQVTRTDVVKLADELKLAITDSALEYANWFEDNADSIYVVSGGFEDYIVPVMEELGISKSHIFANRFIYDEHGTVIGFDQTAHLSRSKGKSLQVAELDIIGPIIMIGDGITDYEVRAAGEADEFWAFTQHIARPSVVERADRILTSFEEIETLTELFLYR